MRMTSYRWWLLSVLMRSWLYYFEGVRTSPLMLTSVVQQRAVFTGEGLMAGVWRR